MASDLLSEIRRWAADLGARLAAAWPFVVAQFSSAGAWRLDEAAREFVGLRLVLQRLGEALGSRVDGAIKRVSDESIAAMERTKATLRGVEDLLIGGGFRA